MDAIKHLLFEDPLYIALGAIEIVLALWWRSSRSRRVAFATLAPPLVGICLWIVSTCVVTDRERLMIATKEISTRLMRDDWNGVGEFLADDFGGYFRSRQEAIETAKLSKERYGVTAIHPEIRKTELFEGRAKMNVRTVIQIGNAEVAGAFTVDWVVDWAIRDGNWRVTSVDEPKILGAALKP